MRRSVVIGALVLAVGTLGACSHSSGGSTAGTADVGSSAGGGYAAGGSRSAPATQPGAAAVNRAVPLGDGSAKIRVADLTVDVPRGKLAAAADRAGAIALGAGGEIDADDRTSGKNATASLRLRVPPAELTSVLGRLAGLGHEVSRRLSTTDVTEKVADVDSRVRSAQQAIARLRALYAQATKVGDVIAIEGELSSREADLESLQAQQRALAGQTAMATVSLTLETAAPPAARPAKHRGGFVGGLERGWDGFVAAAAWVAAAVGTVLPFLLLAVLMALAGRLAWRRMPHRPRPAPSE